MDIILRTRDSIDNELMMVSLFSKLRLKRDMLESGRVNTCSFFKERKIKLATDNMQRLGCQSQMPMKNMLNNPLNNQVSLPTLTLPHCSTISVATLFVHTDTNGQLC